MALSKIGTSFICFFCLFLHVKVILGGCLEAKGPTIQKKQELKPFLAIELNFKANVVLEQQDKSSIQVDAQRQIHDYITHRITGGNLKLNLDTAVCRSKPIEITVNTLRMKTITLNGSGHIESANTLESNTLAINLNGSGSMNFRLMTEKIQSTINGSGSIELSGKTGNYQVNTTGSGTLKAFYLTAQKTDVQSMGSGKINIYVTDKLKADIKGSGIIRYKGGPEVETKIKGTGFVSPTR